MKTQTQFFKQVYLVKFLATKTNKIELSINNKLFMLENDKETDCCNVYDILSGDFIDDIKLFQFNVELSVNDYPNDVILEYIIEHLY